MAGGGSSGPVAGAMKGASKGEKGHEMAQVAGRGREARRVVGNTDAHGQGVSRFK